MEKILTRTDIVILASSHNPSIITPIWLYKEGLITSEPIHIIQNPGFSFLEYNNFTLTVDPERLQIVAKNKKSEVLESIVNFTDKYVTLLSHIPYRALGINFVWIKKNITQEQIPNITIKPEIEEVVSSLLANHSLYFGNIVYAEKEPYLLKVLIEQSQKPEHQIIYNFNFHHEISEKNIDFIKRIVNEYINYFRLSEEISNKLY